MTSLGLLFVMAWLAGIVITTAGLRSSRTGLTVIGALLFVSTVIAWLSFVSRQD